jgi:hypothetical protein
LGVRITNAPIVRLNLIRIIEGLDTLPTGDDGGAPHV